MDQFSTIAPHQEDYCYGKKQANQIQKRIYGQKFVPAKPATFTTKLLITRRLQQPTMDGLRFNFMGVNGTTLFAQFGIVHKRISPQSFFMTRLL